MGKAAPHSLTAPSTRVHTGITGEYTHDLHFYQLKMISLFSCQHQRACAHQLAQMCKKTSPEYEKLGDIYFDIALHTHTVLVNRQQLCCCVEAPQSDKQYRYSQKLSAVLFDYPDTAFCREHGHCFLQRARLWGGALSRWRKLHWTILQWRKQRRWQLSFVPTAKKLHVNDGDLVSLVKPSKYDIIDDNMPPPGRFVYTGSFKKCLPHGHCRVTEPDCFVYDGDWWGGKPHGSGAYPPPFVKVGGLLTLFVTRLFQLDRLSGIATKS